MKPMLLFSLITFLLPTVAYADTPHIVASFSILGDMARQIGGSNIDVKVLVGPNGDAHSYEPTPSDVRSIQSADLVIVNGLGLEGWMDKLIAASGTARAALVASKGVIPLESDDGHTPDPHAWQDITNGEIYVRNIYSALVAIDSVHASEYQANAERYLAELEVLNKWVKDSLALVPPNQRIVITTHDAFRYFGKAYSVTFIAPVGMNTESEATAGDIAHLLDQMHEQHIHALFMENVTDNRLINQLKTDGNAYIGGTLYSDALSPPGGKAVTYQEMFKNNVTLLTQAMPHNAL